MNLLDIIAYLKDPNRTQQVQGLGGLLEDTLSNMQRKSQYATNVMEKALPDPSNLGKVGDRGAYKEAANMAFDALSFAPAGLTVYHGSPAKFTQFDASKIGSGEGAQAYGYGHYVAESPEVAKSYQSSLSANKGFSFEGKSGLTRSEVQDLVNKKYGSKYLDGVIKPSGVADSFIDDMLTGLNRKEGSYPRQYKEGSERAKIYDDLRGKIEHSDKGAFYEIDLPDEQIAKMLDWDKPLSEQPLIMDFINRQEAARTQSVLDQRLQTLKNLDENSPNAATLRRQIEILREEISDPQASGLGSMTGGEYYNYLRRRDMPPDKQAEMFRNAGIPGIRYLDQGSRGVGQGTSNFVVFPGNEGLLTIQKRNNEIIDEYLKKSLLD